MRLDCTVPMKPGLQEVAIADEAATFRVLYAFCDHAGAQLISIRRRPFDTGGSADEVRSIAETMEAGRVLRSGQIAVTVAPGDVLMVELAPAITGKMGGDVTLTFSDQT